MAEPLRSSTQRSPVPAPAPAPAEPARQPLQLSSNLFKTDGRNFFHAEAPAEHTLQDVLDGNYLKHVNVSRLTKHDVVTIDHKEGLFSVRLYIWDPDKETGRIAYFVDELYDRREQVMVRDNLAAAKVEQRGATFSVEYDSRQLKGGFPTRRQAEAWLEFKRRPVGPVT